MLTIFIQAGACVFFWASNARVVYGTVEATNRMADVSSLYFLFWPCSRSDFVFGTGNPGSGDQGRQRQNCLPPVSQ